MAKRFGKTIKNLKASLKDESKAVIFYPKAANIAKKEGFISASKFFVGAAKDERRHKTKIKKLLK